MAYPKERMTGSDQGMESPDVKDALVLLQIILDRYEWSEDGQILLESEHNDSISEQVVEHLFDNQSLRQPDVLTPFFAAYEKSKELNKQQMKQLREAVEKQLDILQEESDISAELARLIVGHLYSQIPRSELERVSGHRIIQAASETAQEKLRTTRFNRLSD